MTRLLSAKSSALVLAMASALVAAPVSAAPVLSLDSQNTSTVGQHNANAWLEIDVKAYGDNLEAMKKHLNGKAKICAILKADAYGNSIDLLMPAVIKHEIPCIGIASNEEARIARAHGYQGVVARVRTATVGEIKDGLQYGIEELFGNLEQAKQANEIAKQANKTLNFHLALNSAGMNRNGLDVTTAEGQKQAIALTKLDHLQIVGIMTHFPVEDEADVKKALPPLKRTVIG